MKINHVLAAALLGTTALALPAISHAGVFLGISIAPPAIPVYEQPIAPGPDYLWTPGYWQWDASVADYFWVPGTWVAAPQPGFLWTPGYWGFNNGFYAWNAGYWGPHIGYYGGVNYGFGFFGHGYEGGYWNNNHFFYNTAYSHVNVNIVHNTYIHNTTIINNVHTSYVGGQGGLQNRPSAGEQAAFREQHVAPTQMQQQHVAFARQDRAQFSQQNHGVPQAAALARPVNSAQGFRQAALPARSAGNNFQPQPGNGQQRGFVNDGGAQRNVQPAGQFSNPGQQQRGFVNAGQQPAVNGNSAAQQRGFGNTQPNANPQQRGFAQPQQAVPPANTRNNGPFSNNRTAGQQNMQEGRQQQQTQVRQSAQQPRQQAPRPAENRGGGGHEEHPR